MLNPSDLSQFVPLSDLSAAALAQACQLGKVLTLNAGQEVFARKATDTLSYYLLSGEVVLDAEDGKLPLRIVAGAPSARSALSRQRPRGHRCHAASQCQLVVFSEDDLDHLLARDQATAYEVTEYEGDDPQWMFDLLRNPAFEKLPPANLNQLFARFQPLSLSAGACVIRQGDAGTDYYLIRSGRARVSRMTAGALPITLAELGPGQGFGEEALISGEPRNASIEMLTDGQLMRLSAADFHALLKTSLVSQVDVLQAGRMVKEGAQMVDVRLESEFATGSLRGSINIPLYLLRLKVATLDRTKPCILICQSGRRSSAAAFLLAQRGFDVRVLSGGLDSLGEAH
ncbi:cyclic nucleotide-binding domain-containing protein [Dechloromonas sp. ZS-1]|uniref:cyclic nucleotide-binding domain-containing protein n=1 Tax=Dechloromonas sp. ZS-1 TaxID=3138067 RepID=UPI0031FCF370